MDEQISNTLEKSEYCSFVLIITCIVSSSAASLSFCSFSLVLSKVTSSKPNSSFLATCILKQKKKQITISIVCKNDSDMNIHILENLMFVNIQAYSYKHNMVLKESHLKELSYSVLSYFCHLQNCL